MREEDTMYWVKDGLKYCKVCGNRKRRISRQEDLWG